MIARLFVGVACLIGAAGAKAEIAAGQGGSEIPSLFRHVAHQYGVPNEVLYAVAFKESRRRHPETGEIVPWPWTINVNFEGMYFESEAAALAKVAELRAAGKRSIDVGYGQVNLHYNGHQLPDPASRFDPRTNLSASARILVEELVRCGYSSWRCAIERYHSPGRKPEQRARAVDYADGVFAIMAEMTGRVR